MSESFLGIDASEWGSLAGLRDPYAVELTERVQPSLRIGPALQEAIEDDNPSYDDLLAAYVEDCGVPAGQFEALVDHALESGDGELISELLAIEAQFVEFLPALAAVGGAALKGAAVVGKLGLKAAGAVGKGAIKAAGSVAKGVAGAVAGDEPEPPDDQDESSKKTGSRRRS